MATARLRIGFRADAVHGKTWAKRGKTPVINRPGQRQSISAASAVNAKGAFWFATYEGGLTGELFVDLLKQLMYRRKKPLHLVVDGLPAHKKANGMDSSPLSASVCQTGVITNQSNEGRSPR